MPGRTDATEVKDLPSRVSRLETVVGSIHEDLSELKTDLRNISESLSRGSRTNWTLVFAGVAMLGGLYSAAVRPLVSDIERQQKDHEKLAMALLENGSKINELQLQAIRATTERGAISDKLAAVYERGVPVVDKRLSILENKVENNEKTYEKLASMMQRHSDALATLEVTDNKSAVDRQALSQDLHDIKTYGSPITDKRLTLIEYQIKNLLAEPPKK